jgi:hypothetical protein
MADPELVRVMDYILNRCDEGAIEAVAAAVVRRRRDLALFGGMGRIPDPAAAARAVLSQVNIGASLEGVRETVRSMAAGIIRREAPAMPEEEVAALTRAWVPGPEEAGPALPPELLASMVDQFVTFSQGRMGREEDQDLRAELGAWPERYWKAFPPVVRLIVTDYLKNDVSEGEFRSRLETALAMRQGERR